MAAEYLTLCQMQVYSTCVHHHISLYIYCNLFTLQPSVILSLTHSCQKEWVERNWRNWNVDLWVTLFLRKLHCPHQSSSLRFVWALCIFTVAFLRL